MIILCHKLYKISVKAVYIYLFIHFLYFLFILFNHLFVLFLYLVTCFFCYLSSFSSSPLIIYLKCYSMLFIVIYIPWLISNHRHVMLIWSSACGEFLFRNESHFSCLIIVSQYIRNKKWCHLPSEESSCLKYIYLFVVNASCTCIVPNDCDINVLTLPSTFYVWGALADNYVLWKLWVFVPVEFPCVGSRGKAVLMCCW